MFTSKFRKWHSSNLEMFNTKKIILLIKKDISNAAEPKHLNMNFLNKKNINAALCF